MGNLCCKYISLLVKRNSQLSSTSFTDGQGDPKDCIGTQTALVLSTIQLAHESITFLLLGYFQPLQKKSTHFYLLLYFEILKHQIRIGFRAPESTKVVIRSSSRSYNPKNFAELPRISAFPQRILIHFSHNYAVVGPLYSGFCIWLSICSLQFKSGVCTAHPAVHLSFRWLING